jgi:nucleoside 2-deoxyribosyltransferase
MKVYIAAPLSEFEFATLVAAEAGHAGLQVVSRWHDEVGQGAVDPPETDTRRVYLRANLKDLLECDAMIALCNAGNPRATFSEIGWALATDRAVVWVQGPDGEGRNLFGAHPLAHRVVLPAKTDLRTATAIVGAFRLLLGC